MKKKHKKRKPILIVNEGFKGKGISLPSHHAHIGIQDTGKTERAKKFITEYIRFKKKLKLPYKILIIETFDEYKKFAPQIQLDRIASFKNGVKVFKADMNCSIKQAEALLNFRDGLIIIENSSIFTNNAVFKNVLLRIFENSKHTNVSTYSICHSQRFLLERHRDEITSLTISLLNETNHPFFFGVGISEQLENNDLIHLGLIARHFKVVSENFKIREKYKRKSTQLKYERIAERYQSIHIDLSHKKIRGIEQDVFSRAVMSYAYRDVPKNIIELVALSDRIKNLSKYY